MPKPSEPVFPLFDLILFIALIVAVVVGTFEVFNEARIEEASITSVY